MAAFLKTLQRAANDFRPRSSPRVASVVTLARADRNRFSVVTLAFVVGFGLLIAALMAVHQEQPVVAKLSPVQSTLTKKGKGMKMKRAPIAQAAPASAEAYDDIVLPAESLKPPPSGEEAPAPDSNPIVDVVAQEINSLPAVSEVKHAEQQAPVIIEKPESSTFEQNVEDAHAALEAGDNAAALAFYDQALAKNPDSITALKGKVYVMELAGQYDDAVDIAHRLVRLDPHDATLRASLVAVLGQAYKPAAMTELQGMVDANPSDASMRAALAKLLVRRGYMEEAFAQLTKAIQLAPHNLVYQLDLAILYDQAGHNAEAIGAYHQVLRAYANQEDAVDAPFSLTSIRQRVGYLEAAAAKN